jgi:hypothetical protein
VVFAVFVVSVVSVVKSILFNQITYLL